MFQPRILPRRICISLNVLFVFFYIQIQDVNNIFFYCTKYEITHEIRSFFRYVLRCCAEVVRDFEYHIYNRNMQLYEIFLPNEFRDSKNYHPFQLILTEKKERKNIIILNFLFHHQTFILFII